jgi:hypothetical protein
MGSDHPAKGEMGEKPLYWKHIVYTKYLRFGLGDRKNPPPNISLMQCSLRVGIKEGAKNKKPDTRRKSLLYTI